MKSYFSQWSYIHVKQSLSLRWPELKLCAASCFLIFGPGTEPKLIASVALFYVSTDVNLNGVFTVSLDTRQLG